MQCYKERDEKRYADDLGRRVGKAWSPGSGPEVGDPSRCRMSFASQATDRGMTKESGEGGSFRADLLSM